MGAQIVVSLQDETQEYHRLQATVAKAAAAQAGLTVETVFAENNPVQQIHQLFRVIHAAPDERPFAILVHSVTGEGLERVARNAVRAGIGWVLVNGSVRYFDGLRQEHPELPIGNVAVDNVEVGRIQARQVRALAPGGGPVLLVEGPSDTAAASERLAGLKEGLGSGHELKVVNGDWTEQGGEKAVGAWLRLKTSEGFRPCVVTVQNDAMAVGARRAIRAHRREWSDVPVTGCDGLPDGGQRLVRAGELAATIVTPTTAGHAVTLVGRALAGEPLAAEVRLPARSFPPEDELARKSRGGR
jgi:ABC-type sugar transport system substrate-binding protein